MPPEQLERLAKDSAVLAPPDEAAVQYPEKILAARKPACRNGRDCVSNSGRTDLQPGDTQRPGEDDDIFRKPAAFRHHGSGLPLLTANSLQDAGGLALAHADDIVLIFQQDAKRIGNQRRLQRYCVEFAERGRPI